MIAEQYQKVFGEEPTSDERRFMLSSMLVQGMMQNARCFQRPGFDESRRDAGFERVKSIIAWASEHREDFADFERQGVALTAGEMTVQEVVSRMETLAADGLRAAPMRVEATPSP
jgi:hypothetical protein